MAMMHPSLNNIGGRKKKRKPKKAELALAEAERKMLAKHSRPLEKGAKANGVNVIIDYRNKKDPGEVKTLVDPDPQVAFRKMQGDTAPRKSVQYTGTKMLGIAAMHKSCEVPVFSQEEAVDISKMRRG